MTHKETKNLTDEKLVEEIERGNKHAFETIYHRYKDKIYSYILHILNFNNAETDTATTETFIKIYEYLQKNNKIKNFKSLLYTVAHNTAVNLIQKEQKQIFIDTNDIDFTNNDYHNLKKEQNNHFKQKILEDLLKKLNPQQREIVYLYYFEEYDYQKIADVTKLNKNTVGTILSRAKSSLKTLINKYGYQEVFNT